MNYRSETALEQDIFKNIACFCVMLFEKLKSVIKLVFGKYLKKLNFVVRKGYFYKRSVPDCTGYMFKGSFCGTRLFKFLDLMDLDGQTSGKYNHIMLLANFRRIFLRNDCSRDGLVVIVCLPLTGSCV